MVSLRISLLDHLKLKSFSKVECLLDGFKYTTAVCVCMYVSVCVYVCVRVDTIGPSHLRLYLWKQQKPHHHVLGYSAVKLAEYLREPLMAAEIACEERQSVRHQHPYLEYVAHGVSGNYHSQLVVQDGLTIPHRYNTITHSFNKLSMCGHIAKLAGRWELGPSKAPSPAPTHSLGAQHPLAAS